MQVLVETRKTTPHSLLLFALLIVGLTSCDGSAPAGPSVSSAPDVASIDVQPDSASGTVGDTLQFTAEVLDQQGEKVDQTPSWESQDQSVAGVDGNGAVIALSTGTTYVVATLADVRDSSKVMFDSILSGPPASMEIEPPSATLRPGDSLQLQATVRDSSGNVLSAPVEWISSDTSVAGVDSSGLVSALSIGETEITATSGSATTAANITVDERSVASVEVTPSSATLEPTDTLRLDAVPRDSTGDPLDRPVNWSTSDSVVATVDDRGLVTARQDGDATITATVDGTSGTSSITVQSPAVAEVEVTPSFSQLAPGESTQLSATTRDADGNELERPVEWTSSNANVATVDDTGLVTGIAEGSATITATSNGVSGEASISVVTPSSGDVLPAFPGAEGYGAIAFSNLDRSNQEVLFVTNLNNSGAGSLRQAIANADNSKLSFIIFRVGGWIELDRPLQMGRKKKIYIAGQTAPGDGIALRPTPGTGGDVIRFDGSGEAEDIVIRYLRAASGKGSESDSRHDVINVKSGRRIIFDHVSVWWGTDETLSFRPTEPPPGGPGQDVTVQWSIIGPGLEGHSRGGIFGGGCANGEQFDNLTSHHNYWPHNVKRNPNISYPPHFQAVNDVVYNFELFLGYISNDLPDGEQKLDFINNYYKDGPSSSDNWWWYMVDTIDGCPRGGTDPTIYAFGNVADPDQRDPSANQSFFFEYANNQSGPLPESVFLGAPTQVPPVPVTTTSAAQAKTDVLADAGANVRLEADGSKTNIRSSTDQRLVDDFVNGTGPGVPDAEKDHEDDFGGFPLLQGGTPPTDSNSDGIPDIWASAHLPVGAEASDLAPDGYSYLEHYLNGTLP